MDGLRQDLRLALRRLRQNPGFTAVAILTLALGIGANTTIFSALNAILLRPLPVEKPNELVFLNNRRFPTHSYPNYRDLRDRNEALSGLLAYRITSMSLSHGGRNARAWGYLVTGNYFEILGVQAIRGQMFGPADDLQPGAHPLAVISYGYWQRRFGADPEIAGKKVKINGLDFTIVGVAPAGFTGTEMFYLPEIWAPMMMQPQIEGGNWLERRATQNAMVLGRLKPGVTRRQAEVSLNAVAAQLGREHPAVNEGLRIALSAPGLAGNFLRGPVVGFAGVLLAVAGLVLLIACANLASLLLARASDRRRETAIRLALGAGRGRLVRQLLTESLVLSLAGGAAGLLLARWLTGLIAAWRPPVDFALTWNLALDAPVLGFAAAVSFLTTLVFGLAPALASTRTGLVPALKNETAAGRLRRWELRDLLVTAQVGLCLILMIGALLVIRSLQNALRADLGFNPRGAVTVSLDLGLEGYDEERGRRFQQRLLEAIAARPGIESAGLISALPLALNSSNNSIYAEGAPVPKASEAPLAAYYEATPNYLRAMQTRLLAGRDFDHRDRRDSRRVAIVNQAFAARLFPGQNAVGRRFRFGPAGELNEIVGIVEDGKHVSLAEQSRPAVFVSLAQRYSRWITVVARSPLDPGEALRLVRRAVGEIDPHMSLYDSRPLADHLDLPLLPARLAAAALGVFGALAAALASSGVYGVMSYAIARRRREIAIRMALGASPAGVLRLVLARAGVLLGAGTLLGAGAALALARYFSQILYGVGPRDPATYAFAVVLLALIGLAACAIPARRALGVDPATALREQ